MKRKSSVARWVGGIVDKIAMPRSNELDAELDKLGNRLGLHSSPGRVEFDRIYSSCGVRPTASVARSIYYAPDMDGQADPGEVVWYRPITPGLSVDLDERAFLVVGHAGSAILGLLISTNSEHDSDPDWIDIGSGAWDDHGHQGWLRLDKVIEIPESSIRRQGAILPHPRFERVAHRLRADFGWG